MKDFIFHRKLQDWIDKHTPADKLTLEEAKKLVLNKEAPE